MRIKPTNKHYKQNRKSITTQASTSTSQIIRTFAQDFIIDVLQASSDEGGFDKFLGRRGNAATDS